jgi:hypothetical protein
VLDEEAFEILGPGRFPLHRSKREFTWYVRDAMHVRSPVKFNGVSVGESDRDRYEATWLRREKARQERRAKKEQEGKKEGGEIAVSPGGIHVDTGAAVMPTEPRFVSEAYFMDFKFEPGNHFGRARNAEGQKCCASSIPHAAVRRRRQKTPKEIRQKDNKRRKTDRGEHRSADEQDGAITLWVDPKEHQIVSYTFDNVWLDFLPAAWLVRIDELRASMSMGQPFPGIWLPREIDIRAGITLAVGSFEASYGRRFEQYREAATSFKIRIPKDAR